jgi:NAD(P)-dependent dehydrogenase (short-subunit alcohol dehydrogenase family)
MDSDIFNISNQVAIITGAGGVLGGTAARYLASQGAKVVCLGRSMGTIEKTVRDVSANGGVAHAITCDVLDRSSLIGVRDLVIEKFGSIDILLNAAGGNQAGAVVMPNQSLFEMSIEAFGQVNHLNLNGSVLPSLVFGEVMQEKKKGSIINYSSMAVDRAITRVAGYSASKAAIENFTRWMAVELSKKYGEGVRVNAIAPGFFIGDQNRALLTNADGSLTDRGQLIIQNTPFGRFGRADELNGAIHWLCSDASSFVTGTVIAIDGGFSAFSGV